MAKIKKLDLGPKIWHDSFVKLDASINLYAFNEGLAIPYVSPMLAESLGDLPPLLFVRNSILRSSLKYFCTKNVICLDNIDCRR